MLQLLANIFSGAGIALMGGTLTVAIACSGSAIAVGRCGSVMTGVLAEDPSKFGKLLMLQALPGTQGIYGLLVWFFILFQGGFFSGTAMDMTLLKGILYFAACLPMMIAGYFSAISQGDVAADGCALVAKRPEEQFKAMMAAAMVETYAIFALLVSALSIQIISGF